MNVFTIRLAGRHKMRHLTVSIGFLALVLAVVVQGQTRRPVGASLDRQIAEIVKQRDQNRSLMLEAAVGTIQAEAEKAATATGRGTGNYIRLLQLADLKNGPVAVSVRAGDAATAANLIAEMGRLLFLQAARELVDVAKTATAVGGVVGNLGPQTYLAMEEWARFAALSKEDARLLRRQVALERQRDALPLVEEGALASANTQLDEALILSRFLDTGSRTAQERARAERAAKKDPELLRAYQDVLAASAPRKPLTANQVCQAEYNRRYDVLKACRARTSQCLDDCSKRWTAEEDLFSTKQIACNNTCPECKQEAAAWEEMGGKCNW